MNTKLATTQIRMTEWAAIIKDCKSSGTLCVRIVVSERPLLLW